MKNATLTVTFNAEKLDALKFHMSRKNSMIRLRNSMKNMCRRQPVNIWMIKYPVSQRYGIDRGVPFVLQLIMRIAVMKGTHKLPCTRPVLPPVCPCVGFCGRGWHLYTLAGALRTVGRM